jgi:toxin-antitoxin system PIN domain toxin
LILPDVNVLIYAFRTDSEDHQHYKDWLTSVVNGPAAYGIAPQVLVRITTHARIYRQPSSRADAFAFCRLLLEQPNATVVTPGARHWAIFEDLCVKAKATGNLAQDAWFAALAVESGCEWITTDRDYARFPGLTWREPLSELS